MDLKDLTFVTSNKNKVREIGQILGPEVRIRELDISEIQSLDLDQVVSAKAKAAFQVVKKPVVVEDVSFEIEALNGLPGTFIKFFMQRLGSEKTACLVGHEKTNTTVTAAVALYDGIKLKIFKGVTHGTLSKKDRGTSGFAFDHIFIPKGHKKTFAEMNAELKNKISHRAKAFRKLKRFMEAE